jgi:hypothetical protein
METVAACLQVDVHDTPRMGLRGHIDDKLRTPETNTKKAIKESKRAKEDRHGC